MEKEETKKRTNILTFGSIKPIQSLHIPQQDISKSHKKSKRKNSKNRKKNDKEGKPPMPMNMSITNLQKATTIHSPSKKDLVNDF